MPEETLLFCLPHAGGSAGFYLPLAEHLPRWLRLVPVELPGRGRRSIEPPCGDFEQLAEDVAARIRGGLEWSGQPRYAVFGHSLGAILAFYEARKLKAHPPFHVFLSSPPIFHPRGTEQGEETRCCHNLPREKFLVMLREMGGLTDEVMNSPALIEYAEPVIRADFAALETWFPPLWPPLDLPFTLFSGEAENRPLSHWAARTTGTFASYRFPGGHFYLTAHWEKLAALIVRACGTLHQGAAAAARMRN